MTDTRLDGHHRLTPEMDWFAVWCGLFAAVSPLALLLVNQEWFYTQPPSIDAWHYVGFFMNYDQPAFWPGAYKLARLPWILSGYALYRLFSPDTASLVLHSTYLAFAVGAFFAAVWFAFRSLSAALFASLSLGFFTHFHGSNGWDYHNTAAGAFYLMTLALLHWVIWRPTHRAGKLVATGVTLALTIHCNITYVNFVPFVTLHYVVLISVLESWSSVRRRFWRDSLPVLLGSVLVTALLSTINVLFGREALFFWPLVTLVRQFTTTPTLQAIYWHPWNTFWFSHATYLSLPTAVLVASLWTVLRRPWPSDRDPSRRVAALSFLGQFLGLSLLWIIWQSAGQTALDFSYFAFPLVLQSFLALAAILYLYGRPLSNRQVAGVGLFLAVIFFLALVMDLRRYIAPVWPNVAGGSAMPPLLLGVGAIAAIVVLRGSVLAFVLGGLLLSGANVIGSGPGYSITDQCRDGPDVFRSIVAASKLIAEVDPDFSRSRIWYQEDEKLEPRPGCPVLLHQLGVAIATASINYGYLAPPWPMPGIRDLPENALREVAQDERLLVMITRRAENVAAMEGRFADLGIRLRRAREERITNSNVDFDVYIWETSSPETPPETPPRDWRPDRVLQRVVGRGALRQSFQVNVYGRWFNKSGVLTQSDGMMFFEPTTTRDHVALPFEQLPVWPGKVASERRWLVVKASIEQPFSVKAPCRIVLQDNHFVTLGTMGCPDQAQPIRTMYVSVPVHTKRVRIDLQSKGLKRARVPDAFELVDMVWKGATADDGQTTAEAR